MAQLKTSGECVSRCVLRAVVLVVTCGVMCRSLYRMLVNLGDLPQPEQNVLSQTVWSPLERGNSAGYAGPALGQGQAPNAGAPPRGVVQEYRALTTTVPPPISVRTASDSPSVKSLPSAVRGTSGVASPAASAGELVLTKRPDSSTGDSDHDVKRPRL
jgi:hypothetical protein